MNLPVTSVPGYSDFKEKTLGLKNLQFPDTGASGEPPNEERVFHHRTDELFKQQDSLAVGQTAPPVLKRTQHFQSLCAFFLT